MNNCRHCGGETVAALCGRCVNTVRALAVQAGEVLPLMEDEIAKDTAKASIGSASGGDKSVLNIHALEARDDLRRVILLLQDRAGCRKDGKPETLGREAYGLQKHRYGQSADDPLYSLVEELQDAVKKCWRTVDAREEKITAGKCVCGETLRTWRGQKGIVVCHKCRHISTLEEAEERLNDKIDDGVYDAWLTNNQMSDALTRFEIYLKPDSVSKMVRRAEGEIPRDDQNRTCVRDVVDYIERKKLGLVA